MTMGKISIGVLGATGMVGQTILNLLSNHPWFEVTAIAASEQSAGKKYGEVMASRWNISPEIPEYVREMKISECRPGLECEMVLSALDSSVALEIEQEFAKAGYAVSSNASNHRMHPDVPLLIPEVNADHVKLIDYQRKKRGWKGFIVTDPNCSTIGLTLALKPLLDNFGLEKVIVTTMQGLSGAGYPGVPSMDIVDNLIPYIKNEEEKLESEAQKILGKLSGISIKPAEAAVSANCNRVAVRYGHTECASVKLSKETTEDEIIKAFNNFHPLKHSGLPSAPEKPLIYLTGENRPQPKLDVNAGNGMTASIGRLRKCNILDYKFVVLSHNLIRGAAGAAILNAELLKTTGYIGK